MIYLFTLLIDFFLHNFTKKKAKGFKKVKNPDLWQRFLKAYVKHNVKFVWVKGHAGNIENGRCDELAVAAAMQKNLLVDEYYENSFINLSIL